MLSGHPLTTGNWLQKRMCHRHASSVSGLLGIAPAWTSRQFGREVEGWCEGAGGEAGKGWGQLWTYHRASDFAAMPWVTVRDATELLPLKAPEGMLAAKWCLPNIADVVRFFLRARRRWGWFIDLDTWWCKPLQGHAFETRAGHVLATQSAKPRRQKESTTMKKILPLGVLPARTNLSLKTSHPGAGLRPVPG